MRGGVVDTTIRASMKERRNDGPAGDLIAAHRAQGRDFTAAGVRSFVAEKGAGEAVLCLHGIPASSFLYRKVLPGLAARRLRGVAFDLPGLGLAERPEAFDYTWTGFGAWCAAAVDALELERFHPRHP